MTFTEVFERILEYWPQSITISDARAIPATGWLFPTLSSAWSEVEERINPQIDSWGSLMVWTMFQVFHAEAQKLRQVGTDTLLPRTVDRAIIEEKYFDNLHGEGWSEELAAYRRI